MAHDYNKKHFLILRLSSIGDVLHATPVARQLKKRHPHCRITWLASPPASELLASNPDIDELLLWDRRPFDRAAAAHRYLQAKRHLDALKPIFAEKKFDIVLDIQCLFLTGLIAKMSRAPRRIGIHDRHEFNHLFMTERAPAIESQHKLLRYLSALVPLGIPLPDPKDSPDAVMPMLRLPKRLDGYAAAFWQAHGIDCSRPILMVNTRTSWPNKNWATASFAAALTDLPERLQIVFSGAPGDKHFIEEVQQGMGRPSLSIAGEPDLLELAALFRSASLLFTGDTGPLHIAAAVGTPTLSLWGPTSPAMYGPLAGNHIFLCSPAACNGCNKTHCKRGTDECMAAITPQMAEEKLRQFFRL